jgi:hypothetical protein
MMTRKDYVAVSSILKEYRQSIEAVDYLDLCSDFAKYMAQDNERFDAVRFLEACKAHIPTIEYPSPKSASQHLSLA